MCVSSHWQILFNIRIISCACELRTKLICLWIKVDSVIQTSSAAHIKENMSNLSIKHVIGHITSQSTSDTRQKMSILTHNNYSFEQTISPSTIENLHEMSTLTPTNTRTKQMFIRTNNFPFHYWHPSKDNSHILKLSHDSINCYI